MKEKASFKNNTKRSRIHKLIANKQGSEAIEMVYSTIAFCIIILCVLLILSYAIQVNQISYAAKRVARYVEVTGKADPSDLNLLLGELLSNKTALNAYVSVSLPAGENYVNYYAKTIQLRDKFTVTVSGTYTIPITNPDPENIDTSSVSLRLPIIISVDGQSEIYWKTNP
jgi:hypothetical protein